ncbi:MAG: beta-ketoacyl-[acyl-carrier-protein] synthase family protein [Bryobacteraceae bacterium]
MKRVVVTGLGVVSPVGVGTSVTWDALLRGDSGIRPVASFDTAAYPVHLGGEVPGFDPAPHHRRLDPAKIGRASQLAIAAARIALTDAGIDPAALDRSRIGVSMGTTSGEPTMVERYNDARKAAADPAPELFRNYPCHVIPAHVAAELELGGPALMIPTACAAGNYAIGYAFDLVRTGRVDAMLAGGADAFSRIPYTGFAQLGAIAPERCQPFDRNRKGMVPGEGAAILVLQPLDAVKPGTKIYAEILGYGVSCDAHHMTAAHPDGDGAIRAMSMAMRESGVTTEDVGYISAHGTGTKANDRIESIALHGLFGERAPKVPMSSIKSMIGHTMGAASAIEAAVCSLVVQTGWAPPTANFEEPDPECEVDCVPNQARKVDPRVVLNNAYAFGGNNASLCLRRYEG